MLRYLQTHNWETVNALQLRRELHTELENIMHTYLPFLLERELKSADFLHRLRREAELFVTDHKKDSDSLPGPFPLDE